MTRYIPFNRASLTGKEFDYVAEAIRSDHISGDGAFTKRVQSLLERGLGAPKALLTTSCTHALEMAALLLDLGPGDEVVVPSFTFVSTVNAFALRGARPVFADIRPDTLNLDEAGLERLLTPRTKAIAAVHYAGVGCEMDAILRTAQGRGIPVVEDNAHGLFARYRGRFLGTFGCLAAQSFHETKNFTCGEGGALVINDPKYVERAEIIREKGTNRTQFFRGQVDKYSWMDIGSSYLPSDILAAFLCAQLEKRDDIQARRKGIWDYYAEHLRDWAGRNGVRLPMVPPHCDPSFHMFYLIMPSAESRDALLAHTKERGVLCIFHYLPLHLSPMGRKMGGVPGMCPVTEDLSARLVRLPFYNTLTQDEQDYVIETVQGFRA